MFDNGPETESERLGDRALKGVAWLAGIVAVFALAIIVAAAFHLGPTPSPAKPSGKNAVALRSDIGVPDASAAAKFSGKYAAVAANTDNRPVALRSITIIAQEPAEAFRPAASEASKAVPASKKVNSSAASMSQVDKDRIEREALEVIHGDYGNNPGRAAKLGADYELVQARVNQMLHS